MCSYQFLYFMMLMISWSIDIIHDFAFEPSNLKEQLLDQFLNLCTYFSYFINGF
jgi:hypothetical protein